MEAVMTNPFVVFFGWLFCSTIFLTFVPINKIEALANFFKMVLAVLPITSIMKVLRKDKEKKDE